MTLPPCVPASILSLIFPSIPGSQHLNLMRLQGWRYNSYIKDYSHPSQGQDVSPPLSGSAGHLRFLPWRRHSLFRSSKAAYPRPHLQDFDGYNFFTFIIPFPAHSGHLSVITLPSPPQCGQEDVVCIWPMKVEVTRSRGLNLCSGACW